MIQSQNNFCGVLTYVNQTFATNATNRVYFDTRALGKKWNSARILLQPKSGTAAQAVKLLALSIQEADDTQASSFSDITGYTGTTNSTAASGEFVIPVGNTTGTASPGAPHVFDVDLKGKKRYIGVLFTMPNATANSAHITYELSGGDSAFLANEGGDPFVTTGTGVYVNGPN